MNHQHDPRSLAAVHPATGGTVSASGPAVSDTVLSDMLARGLLRPIDAASVDNFLSGQGLRVLFFPGTSSHRRDAHDVAVALREVLRDYRGGLEAGLVSGDEAELQPRFRILVLPSLVLVLGSEILELVPGVRDWADYVRVFQRYLGSPGGTPVAESSL
jgi:hydrogenase-1 operon protein HyaE